MTAVLISINPYWCRKIFSGEKTIELRKKKPKLPTPFKCYIYESKGYQAVIDKNISYKDAGKGRGAVVGEFICDEVLNVDVPFPAYKDEVNQEILKKACLTYEEAHRYLGHKSGFGWNISGLKEYPIVVPLNRFIKPCGKEFKCEDCEHAVQYFGCGKTILVAPQSWMYVEDMYEFFV